jgi:hypothetical protein
MEIPMRSHLAAQSTRLVLAVTATVALAASLTACDSDDDTAAAGRSSAQPSSSTTGGTGAPAESSPGTPAATTNSTGSTSTTTGNSNSSGGSGGSGGSSEQSDADDQPARELGDSCRTGDLDFSVTAGDGDYLVVTAKAQNHMACRLSYEAPHVIFNSSERTTPYPAELMKLTPPDTIELSGTTAAYAVLIPNTTRAEDVVEVDAAEISLGEGDSDPASIELPDTYSVSESSITEWYPSPDAATPQAN